MSCLIARRTCACLCLSLLGAASAQSQPSSGAPSIGLAEALSRTVAGNPELVGLGFQIEAAEGRLQQAGLQPNPELDVTVQDAVGTGAYRGFDSTETTVSLAWILERGVRERRVDAASAGLSLRMLDAEIARLDVAAETAQRFLACLAYQGRLANAARAVTLAEQTVSLVEARIAAGRSLQAERSRAEAELARAELLHEDYEHELLSAYHRLSAQWGEIEPDFAAVAGDAETLPMLEPFETLRARVDDNPELLRFMSQQRLDEAELELAEARSRPSWVVSAGVRRYETTDDFGLVAGLAIPLPMRDRNQGRIAEARADVARTRAQRAATRIRIETTLFELYQELNHNLQLAGRLQADVIPRLEQALEDTRRAYELGRYGYSEWRIVQGELFEADNELLETSVDAHRIVIEIERLTGVQVAPPAAPQ
jgi:cobalt-zinc-cadmium efflux system outer membrane protein